MSIIVRWVILMLFLVSGMAVKAQKTEIYTNELSAFRKAQDLFDKEKYSLAQNKFEQVIDGISNPQDENRINSEYYYALCALNLFHKDAEFLLARFATQHPDHIKAKTVYFQLGVFNYRQKRFRKVIEYFEQVDPYDLTEDQKVEYHFKFGYSLFNRKKLPDAKKHFNEVVGKESPYLAPATYYHSHINYTEGNNETALIGFKKIQNHPMFGKIAPYYITQIYYKQERYDQLLAYAPAYIDSISSKRKGEFSKLIGDAHYFEGQYKEAIPYLQTYRKEIKPNRDDNYQLGHSYYAIKEYKSGNRYLNKATTKKDRLSQIAYYQMADAYLKLGEKDYARNAFRAASRLEFDATIRQNSLFNYAKLAYELSFNPYDEAIEAFHEYIDTYPDSPEVSDAYEFLIRVYMTTKNYDDALASLDRIKKKDSRMKVAYQTVTFNRAVELYHNKKFEEAIVRFVNVKKYPIDKQLNAQSLYWIGESNYRLRNYKEAVEAFENFRFEPGAALTEEFYEADYGVGYAHFKMSKPFKDLDPGSISNEVRELSLEKAITAFRNYAKQDGKVKDEKIFDALLRTADCYYLLKKNPEAIEYYSSAINKGSDDMAYAYFQKAAVQGLERDLDGQSKTLNELTTKYPNSSYQVASMRDLAIIYMQKEEYDSALRTYEEFMQKYPNSNYIPEMLVHVGSIHLKKSDYQNARVSFEKVLDQYPNASVENESAMRWMKEVFIAENNLQGYYDWMKSRGHDVDTEEMDSTLWEPVELAWKKGNCKDVTELSMIYLSKLDNGIKEVDAYYYMASCLYESDPDKALEYYGIVVDRSNNPYYTEAARRAAVLSYRKNDYQLAVTYYDILEDVSAEEEDIRVAIEGQLRCFWNLKNYASVIEFAEKTLGMTNLDKGLETDAQLYLGVSQKEMQMFPEAIEVLQKCADGTQSEAGAQANYCIAEILHLQGEFDACKDKIVELAQQKPSYDYWVAQAFILLGDNFIAQEDYFNAKHSLQSVVDNYEGREQARIVGLAQEKLDYITQLENQEQTRAPQEDVEVDFGTKRDKDQQLFEEEQEKPEKDRRGKKDEEEEGTNDQNDDNNEE